MSVKKYLSVASFIAMFFGATMFVAAQSSGCNLTVKTTANNGTVWGTVMATYGGTTVNLSNSSQKLSVPCGAQVTLTEKPTNPSSWQFEKWVANGVSLRNASSSSVTFMMSGPVTIHARYNAVAASSGSSSSTASSWG